jgi:hypothetical protein
MRAPHDTNGITTGAASPDERKEPTMRSTDKGRFTSGAVAGARGERAPGRRAGRILGSISLLAVAITLAGCEGDNLFAGDSPDLLPRVMGLSAPDAAVAGETISVRVDAFAPHGVAQIVVSLEGAVSRDTIVDVQPPRSQVSQTIRVPVPPLLSDTLLTVRASITDALGNVSLGRTTEVVAYGPPDVTSITAPASVRAGDVVSVEVKVSGARRVTRVDYQVRGAVSRDTSIVVAPSVHNVTQTWTFQVPSVVQDTVLLLNVSARDESGFISLPEARMIPLSVDPPVLSLNVPSQVRAGDQLEVKVAATGLRKVSQIRVALRGAHVQDVVVAADPQRSDFQQTISIPVPGDVTFDLNVCTASACTLAVDVVAIDIAGAISATSSANVSIPIGPPSIMQVQAPAGGFNNQTVDLWISAQGLRPLSRIEVRWREAVDATQSYAVNPQRHEVTDQNANVLVPDAPKNAVLIAYIQAFDVAGESSPVHTVSIPITIVDDSTSASLSMGVAPAQPVLNTSSASAPHARLDAGRPAALLALRQRPLAGRREWRIGMD